MTASLTRTLFLSLIPTESLENDNDNHHKLTTLRTIFNILDNFWFNETVPRDFKRTILSPFSKGEELEQNDPANFRPISLLNTLMKI